MYTLHTYFTKQRCLPATPTMCYSQCICRVQRPHIYWEKQFMDSLENIQNNKNLRKIQQKFSNFCNLYMMITIKHWQI